MAVVHIRWWWVSYAGLSYIPPPKPKLPGHNESYNPAAEYVPTEEERAAYDMMDPTDKPDFIPQSFDAMRKVPAYAKYVQERFERCLDLYLCPRARKKRLNVDPESLLPKLPKPRDLQPFPTWQSLLVRGSPPSPRRNPLVG
jgi:ribosome biogenesis protein ERB1